MIQSTPDKDAATADSTSRTVTPLKDLSASMQVVPWEVLLHAMLALPVAPAVAGGGAGEDGIPHRPGTPLSPWQPDWLDIHHLATGRGNATFILLPDGPSLLIDAGASSNWPNENNRPIALRLGYGGFSYVMAGDLTNYTEDGALPWRDILGPAARAAGQVCVATADHHGMFEGLTAEVVRTLRPKVWVIPT